jgi:hypothetical protein
VDFRAPETRAPAAKMARAVVAERPEVVPAHMVLIADHLQADNARGALAMIDAALPHALGD